MSDRGQLAVVAVGVGVSVASTVGSGEGVGVPTWFQPDYIQWKVMLRKLIYFRLHIFIRIKRWGTLPKTKPPFWW